MDASAAALVGVGLGFGLQWLKEHVTSIKERKRREDSILLALRDELEDNRQAVKDMTPSEKGAFLSDDAYNALRQSGVLSLVEPGAAGKLRKVYLEIRSCNGLVVHYRYVIRSNERRGVQATVAGIETLLGDAIPEAISAYDAFLSARGCAMGTQPSQ